MSETKGIRVHCEAGENITIRNKEGLSSVAELIDISDQGIGIKTTLPLRNEEGIAANFTAFGKSFDVICIVSRMNTDIIFAQFLSLSDKAAEDLEFLIDNHGES